ncbi:MAG: DUF499 domain-containing protein [Polyangiaceae bacterium]|nr:DUF499 domain-containing protein [Polyangiaceae bacterium]
MRNLIPWIDAVSLHPDVLSDSFSEDIFALDLGPLADHLAATARGASAAEMKKLPSIPAVYRDSEQFFRTSYLTQGLRGLLEDVLDRLNGGPGSRVLKLMTAFGGGKSHTLAALLHAARSREALDVIPEARDLPRLGNVRVAVVDGQFFDATVGKVLPGTNRRASTIWGWIAWCLGGLEGYELLRVQDEARVAPGGDDIAVLLGDKPNLLLLDEVLEYLISAGGVKVEQTTLRDETLSFLKRLTVAVGSAPRTAMVFSLQSSKKESLDYTSLLQTVDHLAARKDQIREPVDGNEILGVIQRRLLGETINAQAAIDAGSAYQEVFSQMRRAYAVSESERTEADNDSLSLRDRIRYAYPFHPAIIDLMRERWAAIPEFQRTRGALRFLAKSLKAARIERNPWALLGPGEVPIQNPDVRLAFFKEIGQQADYKAVFEHDFIGANARVRRIDERRAREIPSAAGKRAATRIATVILMYSFGGLRRDGGGDADLLPPGITEPELLDVCVGPDLDTTTVQACLKELKEQCLYLHFDGVRYCFKKDPNVTLLIEQEADLVAREDDKVRERCREMLDERLQGQKYVVPWPSKTSEIPDGEPNFHVVYLPFEFGTKRSRRDEALEVFERFGNRQRVFRNGICLAIPGEELIELIRRSVRYLIATEQVLAKAPQLNLSAAQVSQVKERLVVERTAAESGYLRVYSEAWLAKVEGGQVGIDELRVGSRPLETTLDEKKRAKIHPRLLELVVSLNGRIFDSVTPERIVALYEIGQGDRPKRWFKVSEIVAGFYSYLGFPRLMTEQAVLESIASGVGKGLFGYLEVLPESDADGVVDIDPLLVRFSRPIASTDILRTGYVVARFAIPPKPTRPVELSGGGDVDGGSPEDVSDAMGESIKAHRTSYSKGSANTVELMITADRQQLYQAWAALANLADIAGKVTVVVRAVSEGGFDGIRVKQAVAEPLRELGLVDE